MNNVKDVKVNECKCDACVICGSEVDVVEMKGKCVCRECVRGMAEL